MNKSLILRASAMSAVLFLAACGGGGDSSSGGSTPTKPKANPNPTTTVTACSAAGITAANASTAGAVVCMLTSDGEIVVELDKAKAPITTANFLAYVNNKFYDNTIFHRVVPNFVVQGGGMTTGFVEKTGQSAAIKLESNVGLSNKAGTIAMARTSAADSATSQFYFNTVDNSASLDYKNDAAPGYAVFGKVITAESTATINKINGETQFYTGADTPATEVVLYWAKQVK
ncbi:peptidylprolyl isomerase [Roseateles violae]|uniref:Peptidyl-prolyl cis-trans isomerase n=1 Tax=Roseateles violae TaxID=3058042 RepID=A0ABT8DSM8_9BURK|nr:peptidylprolyl isomerase [Pelomonas sp. PFR6]MDN3919304.1 peptidylprolyl isomerase [Pelomonas sp. PFR6]